MPVYFLVIYMALFTEYGFKKYVFASVLEKHLSYSAKFQFNLIIKI